MCIEICHTKKIAVFKHYYAKVFQANESKKPHKIYSVFCTSYYYAEIIVTLKSTYS